MKTDLTMALDTELSLYEEIAFKTDIDFQVFVFVGGRNCCRRRSLSRPTSFFKSLSSSADKIVVVRDRIQDRHQTKFINFQAKSGIFTSPNSVTLFAIAFERWTTSWIC